jgi:hypothetical protein
MSFVAGRTKIVVFSAGFIIISFLLDTTRRQEIRFPPKNILPSREPSRQKNWGKTGLAEGQAPGTPPNQVVEWKAITSQAARRASGDRGDV